MVDRGPVSKRGAFGRLAITVMTTAAVVAVIVVAAIVLVLRYQHEDGPGEVYKEAGPGTNAFMPAPSAPTDEERYLYGPLSALNAQSIAIRVKPGDTYWGDVRVWIIMLVNPPFGKGGVPPEEVDRLTANIVQAAREQNPDLDLDNLSAVNGPEVVTRLRATF